jgi:hypothetical protein
MYTNPDYPDCVVRFYNDDQKTSHTHMLSCMSAVLHAKVIRWFTETQNPIDLTDVTADEFKMLTDLTFGVTDTVARQHIPRLIQIIDEYALDETLTRSLLTAEVDLISAQTDALDQDMQQIGQALEHERLRSIRRYTYTDRPPRLAGCASDARTMRPGWWYVLTTYLNTTQMNRYICDSIIMPGHVYIQDTYETRRIRKEVLREVLSFDTVDVSASPPRLGTYVTKPMQTPHTPAELNSYVGRYVECQQNRLREQVRSLSSHLASVSRNGLLLKAYILLGYHDATVVYVYDHSTRRMHVALLSDVWSIMPRQLTSQDIEAINQRDQALREYQANSPRLHTRVELKTGDALRPGIVYRCHTPEIIADVIYLGPYIHATEDGPNCIVYHDDAERLVRRADLTHGYTG